MLDIDKVTSLILNHFGLYSTENLESLKVLIENHKLHNDWEELLFKSSFLDRNLGSIMIPFSISAIKDALVNMILDLGTVGVKSIDGSMQYVDANSLAVWIIGQGNYSDAPIDAKTVLYKCGAVFAVLNEDMFYRVDDCILFRLNVEYINEHGYDHELYEYVHNERPRWKPVYLNKVLTDKFMVCSCYNICKFVIERYTKTKKFMMITGEYCGDGDVLPKIVNKVCKTLDSRTYYDICYSVMDVVKSIKYNTELQEDYKLKNLYMIDAIAHVVDAHSIEEAVAYALLEFKHFWAYGLQYVFKDIFDKKNHESSSGTDACITIYNNIDVHMHVILCGYIQGILNNNKIDSKELAEVTSIIHKSIEKQREQE